MPDTTILLVLAAVFALGCGVAYWLARNSWLKERAADFHHFRCPNCERRIRFLARQSGHKGQCSNCGKPVTFPPVSESIQ